MKRAVDTDLCQLRLIRLICVSRCWQNPNPGRRFPCEPGKGVTSTDPAERYFPPGGCRGGWDPGPDGVRGEGKCGRPAVTCTPAGRNCPWKPRPSRRALLGTLGLLRSLRGCSMRPQDPVGPRLLMLVSLDEHRNDVETAV